MLQTSSLTPFKSQLRMHCPCTHQRQPCERATWQALLAIICRCCLHQGLMTGIDLKPCRAVRRNKVGSAAIEQGNIIWRLTRVTLSRIR